jgi:superfamily I DNA and RNA helicase
VVDEAQDFEHQWIEALASMGNEQTRMIVLEDPAQRLYDRTPCELPGWVVLNSPVNYRSPRAVVDAINAMSLTDEPVEWGGAVIGEEPRTYEYAPGDVLAATEQAVKDLLEEGFGPEQIVVLSIRGVGSSELFALDPSTPVAGRRFKRSIVFDENGNTVYSDGDILLETVHRFKGQAADAVVLVGVPQSVDTEMERNRVFVGMTRGRLRLSVLGAL